MDDVRPATDHPPASHGAGAAAARLTHTNTPTQSAHPLRSEKSPTFPSIILAFCALNIAINTKIIQAMCRLLVRGNVRLPCVKYSCRAVTLRNGQAHATQTTRSCNVCRRIHNEACRLHPLNKLLARYPYDEAITALYVATVARLHDDRLTMGKSNSHIQTLTPTALCI